MSRIGFTISAAVAKIILKREVIFLAKVSVVMPLFNAEKFLELSIQSVLAQTFKDFELILVDDCSTGGTLAVAESFDDGRIKILRNEKNLGTPGATRNVGLDAAGGEYVYFMDDDDVLLERGLEILVDAAEKKSADAVNTTKWYYFKNYGDASAADTDFALKEMVPAKPVAEDLATRIYQEFLMRQMHIASWLFLYRRKFLLANGIKFPVEAAEDVFFNFDVVCATSRIAKIDAPFYIWRPHKTSAQHNPARLAKNLSSILKLHEHIAEKLAPLNDSKFTAAVLKFWTRHTLASYVAPILNQKSQAEMSQALEPEFAQNAPFVATLLQICLQK